MLDVPLKSMRNLGFKSQGAVNIFLQGSISV